MAIDTASRRRTLVTARLIGQYFGQAINRILVVGCGTGIEAVSLAQEFQNKVIGIDLDTSGFIIPENDEVELRKGDATSLEFPDNYFDLIYSFHALEHIPRFEIALSEMARVLVPGGGFFIGTPNRERLIGYLGSETATWQEKFAWNWYDWKARWQGKFKNEYSAHAGFLPQELGFELGKVFNQVEEITRHYYLELYNSYRFLINNFVSIGLSRFLFPAIFFIGKKIE